MPTAEVDGYHCNTAYPGWLNGAEPTVGDGEVSRRICFTRSTNEQVYKWNQSEELWILLYLQTGSSFGL